ncbi:MAG: prepilin-type N-terminal cleavage/methylation domain-containing protein [Bacillota bacterium]|nr:prepilin-type N-terminal cleavage/methylation domain-containing protein [Bacillota bacterium]
MVVPKGKGGFSLVELLVSLGLIGLVIAAAGLLYFSGVKGWERSENQVEVQQNLRIALNTLSTEVRKADVIEIDKIQKKITLTFYDDDGAVSAVRSYRFNEDRKEIWLDESSSTVAMYIQDCSFDYDDDSLLTISVTTQPLKGMESRNYTFSINTRGKSVYEN